MKEPTTVDGKFYFPETRLKTGIFKKCMICGKLLPDGPAVSSHDPDRGDRGDQVGDLRRPTAREVNFLPPRPPHLTMTSDPTNKLAERAELRLKTWLHIVARTKTIPKDFVCSEACEQHSIYGRLFAGHPLNHAKSEPPNSSSDSSSSDNDQ